MKKKGMKTGRATRKKEKTELHFRHLRTIRQQRELWRWMGADKKD